MGKIINASNAELNASVVKIGAEMTMEKYGCSASTLKAAKTGKRGTYKYIKPVYTDRKRCHNHTNGCIGYVDPGNQKTTILCNSCFKRPYEIEHGCNYNQVM